MTALLAERCCRYLHLCCIDVFGCAAEHELDLRCVFFIVFYVRMKAVQTTEATIQTTRGGTRRLPNLPVSAGKVQLFAPTPSFQR